MNLKVLGAPVKAPWTLDFDSWRVRYKVKYHSPSERELRRAVYNRNVARWERLNQVPGGARYGPENEPWADVSVTEFARIVDGCTVGGRRYSNVLETAASPLSSPSTTRTGVLRTALDTAFTHYHIDWRNHQNKSFVTPVKNQGAHGTCWSFGVAENLEGLQVRQGFPLANISEQEFISCCDECDGRSADVSFAWLLNHTGGRPALETRFPYDGNRSVPCRLEAERAPVTLHSWARVLDDGTGRPIRKALSIRGPMGMGIDASCFHGYRGGIVRNCTSVQDINHAVLMVAAGVEFYWHDGKLERVPFFTIKNSWSHRWGEKGYGRFEAGHDWWGKLNLIYAR